jgi:hypothetical protein
MRKRLLIAMAMAAVGFGSPARADVLYTLTFAGGGTGVLDLNFSSIAAVENANASIVPYFVSLTATNVDGQNFVINAANLADGYLQTGTSGQIYTLTLEETQPTGVAAGTDFLDIYTNGWQVHDTPYDATVAANSLTISSPSLSVSSSQTVTSSQTVSGSATVAPEPSTLAMMVTGFCGLCLLAYRKRKGARHVASTQP